MILFRSIAGLRLPSGNRRQALHWVHTDGSRGAAADIMPAAHNGARAEELSDDGQA